MADAPIQNVVGIETRYTARGQQTILTANEQISASIRHLIADQNALTTTTFRTVQAFRGQMMSIATLAMSVDKSVSMGTKTTAQHLINLRNSTGMFYTAFSGNVKQNLAQLFRTSTAVKDTTATLKKEFNDVVMVNDKVIGSNKALQVSFDSLAAHAGIKARLLGSIWAGRLNRLADQMVTTGKQMQWVGRQMMVGITAPFAALSAIFSMAFLDLNKARIELHKFMIDASSSVDDFSTVLREELGPAIEEISIKLAQSQSTVTEVAASWAATGKTMETGLVPLTKLTTQIAALTQGDVDLAGAMELVRSVQSSWNYEVGKTATEMKKLQLIQSITSLQMADIAEALPIVSAAAQSFALSVSDTAALLSGMREKGVPSSQAAQAMKFILARLAAPTTAAVEQWERLRKVVDGVGTLQNIIFDKLGQGRGVKALQDIADAFYHGAEGGGELSHEMQVQVATALVGNRQYDRFLKLLRAITEEDSNLNRALEATKDKEEALVYWKKQLAVVTESVSAEWQRFKVRLEVAAAKIGAIILPQLAKMAEAVVNIVDKMSELPKATLRFATAIGAFLSAMGPLIFALGMSRLAIGNIMKAPALALRGAFHVQAAESPNTLLQLAQRAGPTSEGTLLRTLAGLDISGISEEIGEKVSETTEAAANAGTLITSKLDTLFDSGPNGVIGILRAIQACVCAQTAGEMAEGAPAVVTPPVLDKTTGAPTIIAGQTVLDDVADAATNVQKTSAAGTVAAVATKESAEELAEAATKIERAVTAEEFGRIIPGTRGYIHPTAGGRILADIQGPVMMQAGTAGAYEAISYTTPKGGAGSIAISEIKAIEGLKKTGGLSVGERIVPVPVAAQKAIQEAVKEVAEEAVEEQVEATAETVAGTIAPPTKVTRRVTAAKTTGTRITKEMQSRLDELRSMASLEEQVAALQTEEFLGSEQSGVRRAAWMESMAMAEKQVQKLLEPVTVLPVSPLTHLGRPGEVQIPDVIKAEQLRKLEEMSRIWEEYHPLQKTRLESGEHIWRLGGAGPGITGAGGVKKLIHDVAMEAQADMGRTAMNVGAPLAMLKSTLGVQTERAPQRGILDVLDSGRQISTAGAVQTGLRPAVVPRVAGAISDEALDLIEKINAGEADLHDIYRYWQLTGETDLVREFKGESGKTIVERKPLITAEVLKKAQAKTRGLGPLVVSEGGKLSASQVLAMPGVMAPGGGNIREYIGKFEAERMREVAGGVPDPEAPPRAIYPMPGLEITQAEAEQALSQFRRELEKLEISPAARAQLETIAQNWQAAIETEGTYPRSLDVRSVGEQWGGLAPGTVGKVTEEMEPHQMPLVPESPARTIELPANIQARMRELGLEPKPVVLPARKATRKVGLLSPMGITPMGRTPPGTGFAVRELGAAELASMMGVPYPYEEFGSGPNIIAGTDLKGALNEFANLGEEAPLRVGFDEYGNPIDVIPRRLGVGVTPSDAGRLISELNEDEAKLIKWIKELDQEGEPTGRMVPQIPDELIQKKLIQAQQSWYHAVVGGTGGGGLTLFSQIEDMTAVSDWASDEEKAAAAAMRDRLHQAVSDATYEIERDLFSKNKRFRTDLGFARKSLGIPDTQDREWPYRPQLISDERLLAARQKIKAAGLELPLLSQAKMEKVIRYELEEMAHPPTPASKRGPASRPPTELSGHKTYPEITGPIPIEKTTRVIPEDIAAQMTAIEKESARIASSDVVTKKLTAAGQKELAKGVSLASILSNPKNYEVIEEAAKAADDLDDTIKGYGRGELVKNLGKLEAQRLALTTNTEFKAAVKELGTAELKPGVKEALYGQREGQRITGSIYPSGVGETDEFRRRFEEASRIAAGEAAEQAAEALETAGATAVVPEADAKGLVDAIKETKPEADKALSGLMDTIEEQAKEVTDSVDVAKPLTEAADDVAEEVGESVTHMSGVIADKTDDLSDWIGKEVRVPAAGSLVGGKLVGFEESPVLGTKRGVIQAAPGMIGGGYPVEEIRKFYPTIAGGAPMHRDYLSQAQEIQDIAREEAQRNERNLAAQAKLFREIGQSQAEAQARLQTQALSATAKMAESPVHPTPPARVAVTPPQFIGKTVQAEAEAAVKAGLTAGKGGLVQGIKQMAQMIPMLLTMGLYQPGMFGGKTGPMPVVRPGTQTELEKLLLERGLGEQTGLLEKVPTTGGQMQLFDTVGVSKMGPALDEVATSQSKVIQKTGILSKVTGAYNGIAKTMTETFGPLNLKLLATSQSIGSMTMLVMRLTSALPELLAFLTIGAAAVLHWREVWEGMQAGASQAMSIAGGAVEEFVGAITSSLDENARAAKKGSSIWVSFGKAIGAALTGLAKAFKFVIGVAGTFARTLVRTGERVALGFKGIGDLIEEITGDGKGLVHALSEIYRGFFDIHDLFASALLWAGAFYALTKLVKMFQVLQLTATKALTGIRSGFGMFTSGISALAGLPTQIFWDLPGAGDEIAAKYTKAGMAVQKVEGGLRVYATTATAATSASVRLTGAMMMLGNALTIIGTLVAVGLTIWTLWKDKNDEIAESLDRVTESANTLRDSWVDLLASIKGKTSGKEIVTKFKSYTEELAKAVREAFGEPVYSADQFQSEADRAETMYRKLQTGMEDFRRLSLEQMEEAIKGAKQQLAVEEDRLERAEETRDALAAQLNTYDRFPTEPLIPIDPFFQDLFPPTDRGELTTQATLDQIIETANVDVPKAASFIQKLQAVIQAGIITREDALLAYGIPEEAFSEYGRAQAEANKLRLVLRAIDEEISDLNNIQMGEFATRVNDAVSGVREQITEQFRKAGKESKKAFNEAFQSALEGQLGQLTDAIVSSVMAQLDAAEQAQLDAVDKRIEAINEINEAEEKLQRDREYRRQRQELLDQQELTAAIALRERAKAILEGRYDDARILALQAQEDQKQLDTDIKELDREHKEDLVADRREARIERLEKQKERIQEIFDRERELLQNQLAELTEFGARSEKEWRQMYQNIANLASEYGIKMPEINKQFFDSYGISIEEGITDALRDAKTEARREAEDLGSDLANSVSEGITKADAMKVWHHMANLVSEFNAQMAIISNPGMMRHIGVTMDDITGGLSKEDYINKLFDEFSDAIFADVKKLRHWGFDITMHTGGPVDGTGEVPAVLQSGEYVIKRSAVRKIGRKTLDQINKFHEGGLVSEDTTYALAAGPAMMPFQALRSSLPVLGSMLAGTLVTAAMPFYLQGISYLMKSAAKNIAQVAGLDAIIKAGGLLPDISFTKTPSATGTIIKGKGPFQVFPVSGNNYSYIDTWHAPRSGGRLHEGTDIIAPMGTPLLAVFPGVNIQSTNTLGGLTSHLMGQGGMAYYAHESQFANGGVVKAGDIVGYVGATGNAGGPHLHFGWYPNGGPAVNPYPYLRAVDPKLHQNYGKGGIVRTPTFTRLGEWGPEMVIPMARFNTPGLNNIQFADRGPMDVSGNTTTSVESPINIDVNFNGPFVGGPEAYRDLYLTLEQAGRRIASERGTNVTAVRYGR